VAITGETVEIGAPQVDGAALDQGSAYIFVRSGRVWSQQLKLLVADAESFDQFGFSVAISGETVVVGARFGRSAAGLDQGSAYVFVRSGGVWSQQQKLGVITGPQDFCASLIHTLGGTYAGRIEMGD
jgi:hypothetical protein